ncbi:MAG TPA: YciI family protein [Gaiellaceae bacterium]|nr:YciI family protein [Gaiellaceae bacterium]
MQYLALIYGEEGRWAELSQEDRDSEMGEYMALSQESVTVGGNELDSVATATTVRVRRDETLVTDGPFVELKEALGGYYVFECGTIDEACALAARIPAARHGAVEVRPVYVDGGERS